MTYSSRPNRDKKTKKGKFRAYVNVIVFLIFRICLVHVTSLRLKLEMNCWVSSCLDETFGNCLFYSDSPTLEQNTQTQPNDELPEQTV